MDFIKCCKAGKNLLLNTAAAVAARLAHLCSKAGQVCPPAPEGLHLGSKDGCQAQTTCRHSSSSSTANVGDILCAGWCGMIAYQCFPGAVAAPMSCKSCIHQFVSLQGNQGS